MEIGINEEFSKATDSPEYQISEDEEIDDHQHEKLLESIATLDGKRRITKNGRSEPSLTISEFNTIEGNNEKIKVHELLSTLKQANIVDLKKQVRSASRKSKILPIPLPKVTADKIKRNVAYQEVGEKVSKWDSIVISNRLADHMEYPLKQADLRIQPTKTFVSKFKPKTPLELEVAKLLNESENTLTDEKPLTVAEEKFLKAMSYEEAKERLDELRKMRALLSYQEAKARRQKKIKSKRYHRILKKERIRKDMKEFEELKKTQPELAAEKLLEIDKLRIEERMSLKHKNTGKWAKQHALRAKYNQESRDALSEQLEIGKRLREKRNLAEDSDESYDAESSEILNCESTEEKKEPTEIKISSYNPWFKDPFSNKATKKNENNPKIKATTTEIEKFHVSKNIIQEETEKIHFKDQSEEKFQSVHQSDTESTEDTKAAVKTDNSQQKIRNLSGIDLNEIFEMKKLPMNKKKRKNKKKNSSISLVPKPVENKPEAEMPDEEIINETLVKKNKMEDFEKYEPIENISQQTAVKDVNTQATGKTKPKKVQVDPTNFVMVKAKSLKSKMPKQIDQINDDDYDDENDGEMDDDEKRRMTISEAFADDDVLEEFRAEKRKAVDEGKPQMLSTFLPGWGAWGGEGIKESRKKIRRFRIKPPPSKPRADRQLGNVIIKDGADLNKAAALHMISDLPYPFTNVQQFERSLAQPIGNTWNPESAFVNLVIPKVETKRGKIIEPIDSDALVIKKAPKWNNNGNESKATMLKNKPRIALDSK